MQYYGKISVLTLAQDNKLHSEGIFHMALEKSPEQMNKSGK